MTAIWRQPPKTDPPPAPPMPPPKPWSGLWPFKKDPRIDHLSHDLDVAFRLIDKLQERVRELERVNEENEERKRKS